MAYRTELLRLRRLVAQQSALIDRLRAEKSAEPAAANKLDREALIEFLSRWREEHGVQSSGRYLRNRSTDQLRKMYSQAVNGVNYRVGRRWKHD
jgi:hypothetical protein